MRPLNTNEKQRVARILIRKGENSKFFLISRGYQEKVITNAKNHTFLNFRLDRLGFMFVNA